MLHEEAPPLYNPWSGDTDGGNVNDFNSMHSATEIDLGEVLERPPIAISIGSHQFKGRNYPTPFGSYGDFSCIVGASKSKKTFFKSAIVAGYANSQHFQLNHFIDFEGHNSEGKWIIDIDTEQSKWDAQNVFRRVAEMTPDREIKYKCFYLREYSPTERLEFINWLLTESPYVGNIGLVSIDGYADLVNNFNDVDEANELVTKLLRWSSVQQCHITGILHRNFQSQKPVGHVGSFILKKAETVAFVEPYGESGFTLVKAEYTRKMPFDDIVFEVNSNGLPVNVENAVKEIYAQKDKPTPPPF